MCEQSDLLLLGDATRATERLLQGVLRLPVGKALDLSTSAGFDHAVATLAAKLRRATRGAEAAAVRAAVRELEVDWRQTTPAQRRQLLAAAMTAARRVTETVPAQISVPLSDAARSVVTATREHARKTTARGIRAELSALDQRIIAHVASSHGNFVRDEYGRRVESFGAAAQQIVAAGLEEGLGRRDIAQALRVAAQTELIDRAPFYWEVVAASFTGRGRTFAQVSAFAEADIQRYRIEAVLDEATTTICRFLHGKSFSVAGALRRLERVERLVRPEDIKRELPWVRQSRDRESGPPRLTIEGHQGRVDVAEVIRSGLGARDDLGEHRALASDQDLEQFGLGLPPYHGLCRSSVTAVLT